MKERLVLALTVALTSVAIVHTQATLTGKWLGETANGMAIVLDLAVKDSTLTGTMTRGDERITLSDGHASKNSISFTAKLNDQIESFSGDLTGDELKVWLDRQGVSKAVILKRVKPTSGAKGNA